MSLVARWERATDRAAVQHLDQRELRNLALLFAFFLWIQLEKATAIAWIDAVSEVVLFTLVGLMLFDGVGWLLDKRYREFLKREIKSKAQTWTDVPVMERIEVVDGEIHYSTFRENEKPTRFPSKVKLNDLWGVIEKSGRIQVVKRDMYQTAFTFSSTVFATPEEKEHFFTLVRTSGGKVVVREGLSGR